MELLNKEAVDWARYRYLTDPEFAAKIDYRAVKLAHQIELLKGDLALELALHSTVVIDLKEPQDKVAILNPDHVKLEMTTDAAAESAPLRNMDRTRPIN